MKCTEREIKIRRCLVLKARIQTSLVMAGVIILIKLITTIAPAVCDAWRDRPQITDVPAGYSYDITYDNICPGWTSTDVAEWVLRLHPDMQCIYREKDLAYEIEKINEVDHGCDLGGLRIGYPVVTKDE